MKIPPKKLRRKYNSSKYCRAPQSAVLSEENLYLPDFITSIPVYCYQQPKLKPNDKVQYYPIDLVPSSNYDLLARCVTAPLSVDSQVKNAFKLPAKNLHIYRLC